MKAMKLSKLVTGIEPTLLQKINDYTKNDPRFYYNQRPSDSKFFRIAARVFFTLSDYQRDQSIALVTEKKQAPRTTQELAIDPMAALAA